MKNKDKKVNFIRQAFTMVELVVTMLIAGVISFAMYKAYDNKLINEEAFNYGRNIVKVFDAYVTNKNFGYIKFNGNEANKNYCTSSFYYEVDDNLTMGKVKLCSDLDNKLYKMEFHHIEDDGSAPMCEDTHENTNICFDNGQNRKGRTFLRTEYLVNCRAFVGSRNDQNDSSGSINNRIELFIDCSRLKNRKQRAIAEFYAYNLFSQSKDRISSHRLATDTNKTITFEEWIDPNVNANGDELDGQVLIIFDLGRG